jgi:hypothetical protein
MPGTIYGAIDLLKNELRNAVVQNLGAAPSSPLQGQIYFDSTAKILYWYNGTSWVAAQPGVGLTPAGTVTTQAVGDAPVVGTGTNYAREDHKHGREAFGGSVTAETTFGLASAVGSATTLARSDHTHGTPAAPAAPPGPATTVTTQAVGDAAVVGTLTTYAREDHKHAREPFGSPSPENTFGLGSQNGSSPWVARSDHQHGNPTHVAADHSTIPLSAFAAPTAAVSFGSQNITNLAAPVNATDGVNKSYVDNLTTGMSWKQPVRATAGPATNLALSGLITIDTNVTLVDGDRVLACGQSSAPANGIYIAHSGAWVRALDADAGPELLNAAVWVEEGTQYFDTAWVCTSNAPITIGSSALNWVQFAGSGSVGAGAGMTLSGTTLNVIAGDTSLIVNADELHVNTAVIAPVSRLLNTTAPLTGGGNLSADRTLAITSFAGSAAGAVPTSPGGTTQFLRADGTWAAPAGGVGKFAAALTGTASPEVVTHNLNTRDVVVEVLNGASPYTAVQVDWDATSVNTITIRYNPNLGAGYRAVVVG